MKKYVFILMGLLLFLQEAFPQERFTLEQCIRHALDHNIQVKQYQVNARLAGNSLDMARYSLLPTLNIAGQQSYSFGRSLDMFTNSYNSDNTVSNNFQGSMSLDLFSGFSKINTIRKNDLNLQASLQDMEKMKNDISLNVAAGFLQILYAEENLEVATNQQAITAQQVDRTRRLVEVGNLAQGSLLEVQAQLAAEDLAVVNATNNLDMAYLNLAQMLEIEDPASFRIARPPLAEIGKNIRIRTASSVFQEALTNLPQIKAAEIRLKGAETDLAIARGNYYPRLSLNAIYTTGYSGARKRIIGMDTLLQEIGFIPGDPIQMVYSPVFKYGSYAFGDQIKDNAYRYLTLNLNIPIFNGFGARKSVSNAKLQLESTRYTLDLTRKQLFKEIQQAEADATAALKNFLAAEKSVSALEESFRYIQQKFDVGLVNSVDFNTSKNQLVKSQSDLIRSKYEYLFKVNVLEFYRGNPMTIE